MYISSTKAFQWKIVCCLLFRLVLPTTAFSSSVNNHSVLSTTDALTFVSDICGNLKEIKRKGWVMRQVPFPESDSDHMHRCALCTLLLVSQPTDLPDSHPLHPSHVDSTRLLKMALTHDLCESIAGDVTPFCGVSGDEKYAREEAAMAQIRKVVGDPLGKELYDLWKEYEQQHTVEAIYCKDIDKYEMLVQAYEYEKRHLRDCPQGVDPFQDLMADEQDLPTVMEQPLRRFFQTTRSSLKTPLFRQLDKELRERRQSMLQSKGWDVAESEQQDYFGMKD